MTGAAKMDAHVGRIRYDSSCDSIGGMDAAKKSLPRFLPAQRLSCLRRRHLVERDRFMSG